MQSQHSAGLLEADLHLQLCKVEQARLTFTIVRQGADLTNRAVDTFTIPTGEACSQGIVARRLLEDALEGRADDAE
jgi:hypothetical protein